MFDSKIDILHTEVQSMYRDLSSLENLKVDKSHNKNLFAEVNLRQSQLYTQISMKENSIITIENFLEKYLPIRVLTQISEVILKIFPVVNSAEVNRLLKYEKTKYKQYNHCILHDSGIPDLMKTINDIKDKMQLGLANKGKAPVDGMSSGGQFDGGDVVQELSVSCTDSSLVE